jgi:L-lysine exporter family protein LysE/ArgO
VHISALLAGLGTGLSLIVAIGAQNAYVLRQGLRREHVGAIVCLCALSDMILIALGVGGLDLVARVADWVVPVMRWAGVAFLLVYGALALRRAVRPGELVAGTAGAAVPLGRAVLTGLGLTWLNPHVYLDTVVLLGSVANSQGPGRWWFGAGAMAGSWVFFALLGYGARWLRPLFASARAWRILDGAIAAIMWGIAVSLIVNRPN